jgi:phosphate transport system substrate-binding protein
MKRILFAIIALLAISAFGFAQAELVGAGATFPAPLYTKMFDVYAQMGAAKINYQPIGSGGGITQLKAKTVDFGASDAFLSDKDLKDFDSPVIHIPIVAGAVVITYNLPGIGTLNFSPSTLSNIFLGDVKRWNDQQIVKDNPTAKLPDTMITVVHRSDGSGTTATFSDYLTKVSPYWETRVGKGTSLNWPVGLGGKGNAGVAGLVKQLPGSIGYVELIYAAQNNMPIATIKNKAGVSITPSLGTVQTAAMVDLPADMRISITDTASKEGYPISGFTWILVYKEQAYSNRPIEKAKAVVDLLWWMVHNGQQYAEPLQYAVLSDKALKNAEAIIRSITFNGKAIMN